MQRAEHSVVAVLQQIARHFACVLVASLFLVACGSGSQDADNGAATMPESNAAQSTSSADRDPSPTATPGSVATHVEHEHIAPATATVSAAATAIATATATPTATTEPSAHQHPAEATTPVTDTTGTTEVQILDFAFDPPLLEVEAGTTVTFINQGVDHTATAKDDASVFDTGILHTGESFEVTFDSAGTFDYWCLLHPNMLGTIVVK